MDAERVPERTNAEQGQLIMTFYLICDVSASMRSSMSMLNDAIKRLRRAIVANPVVDDLTRICIISFSDSANVDLPMAQMSESSVPALTTGQHANYGEAFRLLARVILEDKEKLQGQGYRIYRPCAFFLTDGQPDDRDWHQTFVRTLTYDGENGGGMKDYPIFVPFGFRDARVDVLRQLAYPPDRGRWYYSKNVGIDQVPRRNPGRHPANRCWFRGRRWRGRVLS